MAPFERDDEVPVYRQVADAIRADIDAGRLQPRKPIPSELHLTQQFGVARDTVRRAIAHLYELGLVHTIAGRGTYVRTRTTTTVRAEPGMRIVSRPATPGERDLMELQVGDWVLVIERAGGEVEVLPADSSEIRTV